MAIAYNLRLGKVEYVQLDTYILSFKKHQSKVKYEESLV